MCDHGGMLRAFVSDNGTLRGVAEISSVTPRDRGCAADPDRQHLGHEVRGDAGAAMDVGLRDRVAADRCQRHRAAAVVPEPGLAVARRVGSWRRKSRRSWRTPLSMRQMSCCLAAAEWMARFIAPPGPSCWPNAAGAAASVRNSILK